jgi:glycosyltransferase involved in cell wall biosynthesis
VAPEKNLEEFFNVDFPGTKIMIGGGPLLDKFKEKYKGKVYFVGIKRGKELAAYYRIADVFVFPSLSETFGIVMIEAMSCGTPVAAFPCTGPIDVVDSGVTGYLNHDLRKAVELCMDLPRKKIYEGSKKWSMENAINTFFDNLQYIQSEKREKLAKLYLSWI